MGNIRLDEPKIEIEIKDNMKEKYVNPVRIRISVCWSQFTSRL